MNRLTLSLFCNQTLKFIHRHRTIIIESLNHITAMLAHMLCHSLILNSLCHDLYRKMMQYIQQTIHNQKIIDIPVWILKKRAIQLNDIDGNPGKDTHGGIAAAKIIQRTAKSCLMYCIHHLDQLIGIIHAYAFQQFKFDVLLRYVKLLKHFHIFLHERLIFIPFCMLSCIILHTSSNTI